MLKLILCFALVVVAVHAAPGGQGKGGKVWPCRNSDTPGCMSNEDCSNGWKCKSHPEKEWISGCCPPDDDAEEEEEEEAEEEEEEEEDSVTEGDCDENPVGDDCLESNTCPEGQYCKRQRLEKWAVCCPN